MKQYFFAIVCDGQVLEPHYDRDEFQEVIKSLNVAGVPKDEQRQMWIILAALLKLGNVKFRAVGAGRCGLVSPTRLVESQY